MQALADSMVHQITNGETVAVAIGASRICPTYSKKSNLLRSKLLHSKMLEIVSIPTNKWGFE